MAAHRQAVDEHRRIAEANHLARPQRLFRGKDHVAEFLAGIVAPLPSIVSAFAGSPFRVAQVGPAPAADQQRPGGPTGLDAPADDHAELVGFVADAGRGRSARAS